jgi:hypothetical protein
MSADSQLMGAHAEAGRGAVANYEDTGRAGAGDIDFGRPCRVTPFALLLRLDCEPSPEKRTQHQMLTLPPPK